MGKQLRGRPGTNPGKVTVPQKKTSGLNWVLKTPILKQRAAMCSKQTSSSQQAFTSPPMTMSNRTVAESTENPNIVEKSAAPNPATQEKNLIEGNKKPIRRNETFSIKKFPSNKSQADRAETFPDASKNLATATTVTGYSRSSNIQNHSDSFSSDEASDKNDAVERDLRTLRTQLEQAVSTVENALTSYKEWKRLHSIHE